MNNTKSKVLTLAEVAAELGAHPETIRRLIHNGKLKAFKLSGGKTSPYRITRVEIDRYLSGDSLADDV